MGSYESMSLFELIRLTKSSHLSEASPMAPHRGTSWKGFMMDWVRPPYHVNIADISKQILYGE